MKERRHQIILSSLLIVLFLLSFVFFSLIQSSAAKSSVEISNNVAAIGFSVLLILFISFAIFTYIECKRTEKKLRDTGRYFQVIFQQSPVGISFGNKDGSIIDANPMFQTIVGRSAEELAGMKWFDITHPDDIAPDSERFERFLSGEIKGYTIAKRYLRPDGSSVWVNIKIARLRLEERPDLTHICIAEDITDRVNAEEELKDLLYHDVLTGFYNHSYYEKQKHLLDTGENLPLSIIIGDINGLKMVNETVGHAAGDRIIVSISKVLSGCVREGDLLARTGGDEFSILLPKTGAAEVNAIMRTISSACEDYRKSSGDVTYQAYLSLGCATKTHMSESLSSTQKNAEDNMYRNKLLQKSSVHSSLLSSMTTTLYERSHETEEHAQRLVHLCRAIGRKFDLLDEQLNELELLSTLHDIGKIGISDNILNKPGKLTNEEWIEMRKHPEIGCRIAMATQELIPIANYILCHHERWDGTGYPQMLKGDEIPLLSRILSVADAYDAMTRDRPYRKAMTKEDSIHEIIQSTGSQFDPEVVEKFLELIKDGDEILSEI